METRIYRVRDLKAETLEADYLVRASSAAQAVRHAARDRFTAAVATTDDCITLTKAGVEVEESGSDA